MTGKTVLITGTSSGVGRQTAILAAKAGYTVVATMRSPDPDDAGLADVADVRRLDVTEPESITACLRGVVDTHGQLDAVINNAGWAHTLPTIEMCPLERYRAGFEVNFFGVVAVTRAALPYLRASHGSLLTIGSTRGLVASPFNEGYSAAKFAVEGFMESLAPTAAQLGVTISIIVAGPVLETRFMANSGSSRDELLDTAGPYREALTSYLDYFAASAHPGAQTGTEVADVVVRTLDEPEPPFRVVTSDWAADYVATKLTDVDGTRVRAMTDAWFDEGRRTR